MTEAEITAQVIKPINTAFIRSVEINTKFQDQQLIKISIAKIEST